jgi:ABC-type multidrug transport system ATPase subunit
MSAIRVRGLHRGYGPITVLSDLSMTVEAGSIYGLLGPSGC